MKKETQIISQRHHILNRHSIKQITQKNNKDF